MYGRTREGTSITAIHEDFRPYFHLVEPTAEALDALEKMPNYLTREPVTLWYEGKERDCVRV
ncbi:MAG: hypothetical protein GWN18_14240, partial [Thermoplasmata archaeon]|nr:hypothetical protein [Thermoplasmata archaeon]NIS13221.1 hypothetical protein [Thermoplasmata archaeon]NIS21113.1 hypothetical protein [Thermoplasmata archaeon]NIT76545.1 hypothetical protein [Thermoplasmata archaeon]NIU50164.1 hypothetical protein [Thermoplasmata archaeon]